MQYFDEADGRVPAAAPPRSDAERLQAALEALTARDQVLADRNRRLAALEDTTARAAALAARLEAAEEELAALRRARLAEAAEREARIAELERRLGAASPPPSPDATGSEEGPPEGPASPAPGPAPADSAGIIARLEGDLGLERQRNLRLSRRGRDGAAAEAARLQEALDECRRHAATLERELAEIRRDDASGPGGAYARWEDWFRRKAAERADSALQRAEDAVRLQHAVLEEKERLIAALIDRLQAVGEVRAGPDDLKEIIGIGPVIEDLLHGLGITTFEQLASLSAEEEDRIGGLLGAFRERIRRDGWAEQAAELARRRVRLAPGLSLR